MIAVLHRSMEFCWSRKKNSEVLVWLIGREYMLYIHFDMTRCSVVILFLIIHITLLRVPSVKPSQTELVEHSVLLFLS